MRNKWGYPRAANPVMACAVDVSLEITKRCKESVREIGQEI